MSSFTAAQFTGGMNEIVAPDLLDEKTASDLVDAEIENGKIGAIRLPLRTALTDPKKIGHYGNRNNSVVKWYDRYYWSNNLAYADPYYGGNIENYLGIPYPDYARDVSITKQSPASGETGLTGTFKYCVTFVNPNGWEGAPGSLENYEVKVELEDQFAKITVSWSDARVSYAKIYRTAEHGADFLCVGEIRTNGGNIVDKTDDVTLAGLEFLDSEDNYPPPDKGKYLCEHGGVFFLAVGSRLYFSRQGNPHAWPPLNFIGFDDDITGVTPEFQGVLVFTANKAFRVMGADSLETVTKAYIPGEQGCVNFRTISHVNNAPIWLSNDGICLWNGESLGVISRRIMDTERVQVKCAVSANDCYYLFLRDGAIVFDHRNGDVFRKLSFTCDYAWYDADTDRLYLLVSGKIYEFGAGEKGTYRYQSPYIGGSVLGFKNYGEIIIFVDGSFDISVSVDGKKCFSLQDVSGGRQRLKFPQSTVGRFMQISVSGQGELVSYSVIFG